MKSRVFFSNQLVSEANAKLASRREHTHRKLPLEVNEIISCSRRTPEEIRLALEAASARMREA
ncbi:hypothetical protein [Pseudomonas cremoricolorata]|uniref:hypothetical protein n=1 Tax=Pseudomonas cremoricolorata TaxID=157783 RepID=UPI00048D6B89|nr:hypothetical protein [Pseudomonas cremoricolorata]